MIPLATATRRNKPRAKSVTFREIVPTKSQADALAAIYMEVVRHWRNVGERVVSLYDPPALTTDSPPEIEAALTQGQAQAAALIVSLDPRVSTWIERLALWHSQKWAANVLAGSGVDIRAFLSRAVIADDMAASLAWNVSLIRNISDQTRDRIANIVWSGYGARTSVRDVARQLNEAVGLGVRRSRTVASDQTVKLSGALDRSRMLEAGIETWLWRSSHKVNFRPEHQARDGKEYTWSNPPADSPGELPFCGCRAQSVLHL